MKRLSMNDIHAYLDGALEPGARREMEAVLRSDPETRALVENYRQQVGALRRLYDPVLNEPVPDKLLGILRDRGPRLH